jgi:hypothetical protein
VRAEGLEPPRLSSREPKSRASTNSATPATGGRPGGAAYITRNPQGHKKNNNPCDVWAFGGFSASANYAKSA